MDIVTILAVRAASKKRYRQRKLKREAKEALALSSDMDIEAYMKQVEEESRRKKANDIIQTIIAMELVGGNTEELKQKLKQILITDK